MMGPSGEQVPEVGAESSEGPEKGQASRGGFGWEGPNPDSAAVGGSAWRRPSEGDTPTSARGHGHLGNGLHVGR